MTAEEARLNIVFEDDEFLLLNKPAGLVCHPTKTDEYSSLNGRVRLYLGPAFKSHLVNRLDRETSGLVFMAKSPEVAKQLSKVWQSGTVRKIYVAIVQGHVALDEQLIETKLGPDARSCIAIKDRVDEVGSNAKTELKVLARFERPEGLFSLVHVVLHTGRKHQIRIHLQHLGHPIVGEKLYGDDELFYLRLVQDRLTDEDRQRLMLPYQALHALFLELPWRGQLRSFVATPESWFVDFLGPVAKELDELTRACQSRG